MRQWLLQWWRLCFFFFFFFFFFVNKDCRVTFQEITNQFSISKASAHHILHETICMSLVGTETTDRPNGIQGEHGKRTFGPFQPWWSNFLNCIFTGDEMWIHMLKHITKTCLYNFDPHKPNFYVVKLGFTGVYVIFLISAQNIDCGYSLEPPRQGGSNEYPQSMFWAEMWKIPELLSENFHFLVVKFSVYLNT